MRLSELLVFSTIFIQMHDNPDADALASGFGLYLFFQSHGRNVRLIYGGERRIRKSNLVLMVEALSIPAEHVRELDIVPDLLLTVDCQYGERNVQSFSGAHIAVIDHHKANAFCLPALSEVRDQYGACATIVWDMLTEEGFDVTGSEPLVTALYYGLFSDTMKLTEIRHPKDMDMRDALFFSTDQSLVTSLINSNLSRTDLRIAGEAISNLRADGMERYAVIQAKKCDPNILGIISDALIEVDTIQTCVVFCEQERGYKISVRSCERETRANELAEFLTDGVGNGGGHLLKAGGFIRKDLLEKDVGLMPQDFLEARMKDYFDNQDLFEAGTENVPDLSGEVVYEKRRLPIGYVRAADLYPPGTEVSVRMLEGDIPFTVLPDTYLMIGIEGEVYKNDEAYLLAHNDLTDEPYLIRGDYAPTIRNTVSIVRAKEDKPKTCSLQEYAKTCIPKAGGKVFARPLSRRTKIFVSWSDSYMLGNPGDYLAARVDKPRDIYIIRKDIMDKSYYKKS